jgi:hypothetical protein
MRTCKDAADVKIGDRVWGIYQGPSYVTAQRVLNWKQKIWPEESPVTLTLEDGFTLTIQPDRRIVVEVPC